MIFFHLIYHKYISICICQILIKIQHRIYTKRKNYNFIWLVHYVSLCVFPYLQESALRAHTKCLSSQYVFQINIYINVTLYVLMCLSSMSQC